MMIHVIFTLYHVINASEVFARISPDLFDVKPSILSVVSCSKDPLLEIQTKLLGFEYITIASPADDRLRNNMIKSRYVFISCEVQRGILSHPMVLKAFEYFAIPIVRSGLGESVTSGCQNTQISIYSANAYLTVKTRSIVEVLAAVDAANWEALKANFLMTQEILYLRFRAERPERLDKGLVTPKVFLAVLSRRNDVARRELLRRTWLSQVFTDFRFFVCREGAAFEAESDVVQLDCTEEYPVGRKGVLFAKFVADNFINYDLYLKSDDDVYVNLDSVLPRLVKLLQSNPYLYWGFFERGEAHDISLYARGPLIAFASRLLRVIAQNAQVPHVPAREDVLYAATLLQAHATPLDIIDIDADRFAMAPKCGDAWGEGRNDGTWVWHKLTSDQIACVHVTSNHCDCFK